MDVYDIIRTKFFKDKLPKFSVDENWLEDDDTPFFLNSACGSFQFLDLKKLSTVLGIDITAYVFRKIVATWALSHESDLIRKAEQEALQHSEEVAKDRYLLNKKLKPQIFIQTYVQEEGLFPETVTDTLNIHKAEVETIVKEKQDLRTKNRYLRLLIEKEQRSLDRLKNRPLGSRHRILGIHRSQFSQIVDEVGEDTFEVSLSTMKPIQWRDYIVRLVCSVKRQEGDRLRQLWVQMYQGDLLYGIRDERRRAKESNWPVKRQNPRRKDRNSWIAFSLRHSYEVKKKKN